MRSLNAIQDGSPALFKATSPPSIRPRYRKGNQRRGAAAVLGLVLTVSLVTLMAVTLDFGHIHVAETELRRSADAAAMAACWEMYDQQAANHSVAGEDGVKQAANEIAFVNRIGQASPQFGSEDIELGTYGVDKDNGELELNGDTGISAGIKDELTSLIGKTRVIPIYTSVSGNGNNATFTIVRFEGVRILDVKLTGKKTDKRVIVQPAKVIGRGTKIDFTGTHTTSHLVTPVMLVE